MGSAALMRAAIETGRIGRPADKREFLPRFRPTIAGTATGAVMEMEDIPEGVPEPVRRAATVYGSGHPLMQLLLSDPLMGPVWKYFHDHPIKDDFRERFGQSTNLSIPDLQGVDLHWHDVPKGDQALIFLFYAVLVAVNNTRKTPDRKLIDGEIGKLRETQRLVEDLRTWAPWPGLKVDPHVDRAILDIVALCGERIAMLDYGNKPGVVEVKGPKSTIESTVRSIGAATHALYGECCYGQLAVMANVMFSPEKPVKSGDAGHWCNRPPLPLMSTQNGRGPKILN